MSATGTDLLHGDAETPALSIVVPTLDEASSIERTLDQLSRLRGSVEVLVVDGGSRDGTVEAVRARGVRLLTSARGRGRQMHAGAVASRGGALWFLHADTLPAEDGAERVLEALSDPRVVGGNFDVRFDGQSRAARFLTWLYPRLRLLGLCYGDSGIFVRREAYVRVGGFRPHPIFEDLELVRRLRGAGRVAHLKATVVTSSRRFEGRIFALTFARWSLLQLLYWMGVRPDTLGRLYAPLRGVKPKPRRDEEDATAARSEAPSG